MDPHERYRERAMVLFAAALLALNYPLLAIADRLFLPLGIPLLYLYIFLVWLVVILVMARIASGSETNGTGSGVD